MRPLEGPIDYETYLMEQRAKSYRPAAHSVIDGNSFAETGYAPQKARMEDQWGKRVINGSRFPDSPDYDPVTFGPDRRPVSAMAVPTSAEAAPIGYQGPMFTPEEQQNLFYQEAVNYGLPGINGTPDNDQIASALAKDNARYDQHLQSMEEQQTLERLKNAYARSGR